jgi:hypothetical protein
VCNSVRRKPGPGKLVINGLIISSATMENNARFAGIVKRTECKAEGMVCASQFCVTRHLPRTRDEGHIQRNNGKVTRRRINQLAAGAGVTFWLRLVLF